jgi:hypothetical protein
MVTVLSQVLSSSGANHALKPFVISRDLRRHPPHLQAVAIMSRVSCLSSHASSSLPQLKPDLQAHGHWRERIVIRTHLRHQIGAMFQDLAPVPENWDSVC